MQNTLVITSNIKSYPLNDKQESNFNIDLKEGEVFTIGNKVSSGYIPVFGYNNLFSGTIMIPINNLIQQDLAKIM